MFSLRYLFSGSTIDEAKLNNLKVQSSIFKLVTSFSNLIGLDEEIGEWKKLPFMSLDFQNDSPEGIIGKLYPHYNEGQIFDNVHGDKAQVVTQQGDETKLDKLGGVDLTLDNIPLQVAGEGLTSLPNDLPDALYPEISGLTPVITQSFSIGLADFFRPASMKE